MNLAGPVQVKAELMDMQGKLFQTIDFGRLSEGENILEVNLNRGQMLSGSYILSLDIDGSIANWVIPVK